MADRGDSVWDRWDLVDQLLERVLDLPVEEREALLERECADDPELARTVASLVQLSSSAEDEPLGPGSRILKAVLSDGPPGAADAAGTLVGTMVGSYRLTGKLGAGGMGTVFSAERADEAFKKTVAVKILKQSVNVPGVAERFRQERQILASLSHPGIAQILDGGVTEDGRPFFVMERVDGATIDHYADQQELDVDGRIRLILKVAEAVEFAHRHMVVHRDLKPNNILVREDGAVKLLDFGIAKLLDGPGKDGGAVTRAEARFVTPEYAAPEQLLGEPVNAQTDVYSLAALLYELLTSVRPYARDSDPSVLGRVVQGAEPTAPSAALPQATVNTAGAVKASSLSVAGVFAARGTTPNALRRRLTGDLDAILMRGLRARPADRYPSVRALRDDLQRHLAGEAVRARGDAWSYRAGKFVSRHRTPLAIAAAVFLLTAGSALGLAVQRGNLIEERNRAEAASTLARSEAERAQEVQNFLVGVFKSPNPYALADPDRGTEITVREALDLGVVRIREELSSRPELQASLLGAVGDVYSGLGLGGLAVRLHDESLTIERSSFGERSVEVVHRMRKLGTALAGLNQVDTAIVVLTSGLELANEVLGTSDTMSALFMVELGRAEHTAGRFKAAEGRLLEALERTAQIEPRPTGLIAATHYWLAAVYPQLNEPERALEHAERALEFARDAHGDRHATTAVSTVGFANALATVGRVEESIPVYQQGVQLLSDLMGPEHPDALNARNNLALRQQDTGDLKGAEAALRELLDLRILHNGEQSRGTASALQNLAVVVEQQGRLGEAEALLDRAYLAYAAALPEGHYLTAFPLLTRAGIQLDRGDYAGARRTAERATGVLGAALPANHYATAVARCRWGRALVGQGRIGEGRRLLTSAAEVIEASTSTPPDYEIECLEAMLDAVGAGATGAVVEAARVRLTVLAQESRGVR